MVVVVQYSCRRSSSTSSLSSVLLKPIATLLSPCAVLPSLDFDLWHVGWFFCDSDNPRPDWSGYSTIHFASAAVAVAYSHMTASSSASWSRFSPPSNFVSGHISTMWLMVCRWPQSQEGDWARPHSCKFAPHGP